MHAGKQLLRQLRYSGMLEYVNIRQTGYGARRTFADFVNRFYMIAGADEGALPASKESVLYILNKVNVRKHHFQMGFTMLFICEQQIQLLEDLRVCTKGGSAASLSSIHETCP